MWAIVILIGFANLLAILGGWIIANTLEAPTPPEHPWDEEPDDW